jgi:O-antigen/teichoic acid export membrane protein
MRGTAAAARRGESRLLGRFADNALSILSSEVVIRATNFVVYALIARRLGAFAFGQLALALSLFYVFQILATAGQRTLMIRDIARYPASTSRQLRSACAVVTLASALAFVPLAALIAVFGWERETVITILAVFVGLLPSALSQTCEGAMQGLEQMRFIAYANVPLHVAKAVVVAVMIYAGAGVVAVALALAGVYWLVLAADVVFVRQRLIQPAAGPVTYGAPGPDPVGSRIRERARRGSSFLGVDTVFAVGSVTPVLVVSALLGEAAVGVLGAAQQAVMPLSLAINSLLAVAYPAMCRTFELTAERTRLVVVTLVEAVLMVVLPFVISISVFSELVVDILYPNKEFDGSADLLRLIVWWSVANLVASVMGVALWALNRERTSMVIGLWSTLVSLVTTVVFVEAVGLNGVAMAMACVTVVILVQHYRALASSVTPRELLVGMWRPAVAGAAQAGFVVPLATVTSGLIAQIALALAGVAVYGLALVVLNRARARHPVTGQRQQLPLAVLLQTLGSPAEPAEL